MGELEPAGGVVQAGLGEKTAKKLRAEARDRRWGSKSLFRQGDSRYSRQKPRVLELVTSQVPEK